MSSAAVLAMRGGGGTRPRASSTPAVHTPTSSPKPPAATTPAGLALAPQPLALPVHRAMASAHSGPAPALSSDGESSSCTSGEADPYAPRLAEAAAPAGAVRRASIPSAPPRPRPLTSASFLTVGQVFCGSQTVNVSSRRDSDNWRVNCCIQGVDLRRGTVCGSMEALDVPKAASPVVTFWEGEIVDNVNFYFLTRRWGAQVSTDLDHWRKFRPFALLNNRVELDGGDDIDMSKQRCVFMRWKEQFFVNCDAEDCGLTIQGFYYLCLDTQTGDCLAYYYDPRSEPFQRLQLTAQIQPGGGHCHATYGFA